MGQARGPAGEVVSVQIPELITAAPGALTTLDLQVTVRTGFHVQANPVRNRLLKPIVLEAAATKIATPGAPVYPPSKTLRLEGSDEDLVIYDGAFTIRLPLTIARDAPAGRVTLHATLRYQACDDRYCLFPTTIPVDLPLTVVR